MMNGLLRELRRLVIADAEEVSVDDRREKRVLEEKGAKRDANENQYFGIGHNVHGRIVVRYKEIALSASALPPTM